MANLKAIRKRIGSVKNTQKITRAMKMVAAARLRRAQESIVAARPYADELSRLVADLSAAVGDDAHPLLTARPVKKCQVIVMTSDRGLAGSFNAALMRRAEQYLQNELGDGVEADLRVVGKKGRDYFRRLGASILSFTDSPTGDNSEEFARELGAGAVNDYLEGKTDAVHLVFNRFRAPGSQEVTIKQLLPVVGLAAAEEVAPAPTEFIYEPSRAGILEHVLPLFVQNELHRAALESIASELGARMAAMDAATRNAGEMIAKLTLKYNRARQAAITTELLEIIAGAEALKG